MRVRGDEGDKQKQRTSGVTSHYVLIDCSGSMKGLKLDLAKESLRKYVGSLPESDDVTLITFGGSADTAIVAFRQKALSASGRNEIAETINSLNAGRGTPMVRRDKTICQSCNRCSRW